MAQDTVITGRNEGFHVCIPVCAEAFNPDEDDEDTEPRVVHPKTDEQRCRLQEACRDILLFKTLDQVKNISGKRESSHIYFTRTVVKLFTNEPKAGTPIPCAIVRVQRVCCENITILC